MNTLTELTPAQQTAREIWTSGDYAEVAERLIRAFGPTLVEATGIGAGQRVLDVACGAGNVAIPAARRRRDVTGVDITPALLERGVADAAAAGVDVTWVEGDAEALPFADASFDVVTSAVGVMFAPVTSGGGRAVRVAAPAARSGSSVDARGPDRLAVRRHQPFAPAPPAGAKPARCGAPTRTCAPARRRRRRAAPRAPQDRVRGPHGRRFVDLMRVQLRPRAARLRPPRRRCGAHGRARRRPARLRARAGHGQPGSPRLEAEYQLTLAKRRS